MASVDNLQDSSTQKIFDYCEKYSQNVNLPKYFSGSSVQYLPLIDMPIGKNDHNKNTISSPAVDSQVTFSTDEKISVGPKGKTKGKTIFSKKIYKKISSDNLLESPSDTKKLEWDNGADIGYNNTENNIGRRVLCKCISLPILVNLTDSKFRLNAPYLNTMSVKDSAKVLCSSTSNSTLSSDESLNQEYKSGTQSSSCISKIRTSQESESEESKLLDFKKTISYLKEKIGLPVAHSSPNIQDINDIPEFKSIVSSTHKKLNENDLKKKCLNKSNKKVIELTISKPIIIDWTSSDLLVGKGEIELSLKSEVVSKAGIFHQIKSKEELNSGHKCISTLYSKNKTVYVPKEYSNCSSNCDSFEYIDNQDGNVEDIKCAEDQKTPQQSQNKNDLTGSGSPIHLLNVSKVKNPQDKESRSSSSDFKSFSEDIEHQVEILQKLFKSKGVHLNKKQYLKKLFKSISDGECRAEHPNSSSVTCGSNNENSPENSLKDCSVPSKESPKMDSYSAVGKNTISSSATSCGNTQKEYEQTFTENQVNPDFLLQFAENERAYQINWIDNEILHLSKLKTVLEVKNCKTSEKKANQTSDKQFQRHPIKTSSYKIMQQDSTSNESEREYVIKTKFDVSANKQMNYCFQGKKYVVTDSAVPDRNSNVKFSDNCVSADIKMQAKDKRTSITLTAPRFKNQKSCCSEPDTPDALGINTGQSSYSKLHGPENVSKICSACQEIKCICKEEQVRPLELEPPAILGSDSPENSNSLQKIFHRCSCTVDNKACHCIFVKRLLNRLLSNKDDYLKDGSPSSSDVKTESLFKTNSIGSFSSGNKHKKQSFQPSSNLQLEIPETDRSAQILEPIFGEGFTTDSKYKSDHIKNNQIITSEKHLFNDENPTIKQPIVVDDSVEAHKIEVYSAKTTDTFKPSYIANVISPNKLVDSAKIVLAKTVPYIEQTVKSEDGSIKIVDYNMYSALTSDPNYLGMNMYANGSVKESEEDKRSVPKSDITNKDVSVQAIENLPGHPNTQDEITSRDGITEIEDKGMHSTLKGNSKYQDIDIQAFGNLGIEHYNKQEMPNQIGNTTYKDISLPVNVNLLPERENTIIKQNEIIDSENVARLGPKSMDSLSKINSRVQNTYKDVGVQVNVDLLMEPGHPNTQDQITKGDDVTSSLKANKKYEDIGVQVSGNSLTKIEHSNKQDEMSNTDELARGNDSNMNKITYLNQQQNETANKDVMIPPKDNGTNLASENTKDIGVQANVGLNASSQTNRKLHQKYNGKNRAYYEGKRKNNVEERQSNGNSNKLPKQKEFLINKYDQNIDVEMDTDEPIEMDTDEPVSKVTSPGHTKNNSPNSEISQKEATSNENVANTSHEGEWKGEGSISGSISASVSDSQSGPASRLTCACCKKKTFVAEVCYIQNGNASYAVCCRCYGNTLKPFHYVCNWQHWHTLYLQLLDNGHTSNRYQICKCCKPNSTSSAVRPQGVSYSLVLQEPRTKKKNGQSTKSKLNDFKSDNKVNKNNKENYNKNKKKLSADPVNNVQRKRKKSENKDMSHPEELKKNEPQYSLQEYLNMNRPQFVYSAENRRQIVLNSRILREKQKDILKLHFLENNMNSITDKDKYKLFTEREMRNITKKNYQKLPETQKKLTGLHEKRLRDADKLIRNVFAKKVQKSALKGQWNFPIDKTVTDL